MVDVVVVGGGHNGLVAATYLARAGKRVLVLEQQEQAGGLAFTAQLTADCKCSGVFGNAARLHPSVVTELALAGHGLRTLPASHGATLLRDDGAPVTFGSGGPQGLAAADVAALARFDGFLGRVAGALEAAFAEALPEIERTGVGDLLDMLALGWRLRRLGRREMPEAMRMLPMALRDVTEEHFADDRLRAAVAWPGLRASVQGPFAPGGALSLLYHRPAWGGGLFAPPTFVAGGDGALTGALESAARAAGVTVRTGARVARIRVGDDGVTGVVLTDGEEIAASRVLSTIDPRATMLELLEPGWIDPDLAFAARNLRGHGTVSLVHLVLDGLPAITGVAAEALHGSVQIAPSLRYQEEAADCVKYGGIPEYPVIDFSLPSLTDGSLAPAGKHVLHAWVQYTPYRLRDTDWDAQRDRLGDIVTATLERHAPGLSGRIVSRHVTTPLDLERRHGMRQGHVYHAEMALDQFLFMRPFPGRYRGRMPVGGLYLGGSGCHPGGGLTGLPGKIAARQVLQDWKSARVA